MNDRDKALEAEVLRVLQEVEEDIAEGIPLNDALEVLVDRVREVTRPSYMCLFVREPEGFRYLVGRCAPELKEAFLDEEGRLSVRGEVLERLYSHLPWRTLRGAHCPARTFRIGSSWRS